MAEDITLQTEIVKKPWEKFELVPLKELKPEFSFFDFQAYAIYQSLLQDKYFISLPTGCGKSLCSLASFLYYRTVYPKTKLLLCTTSSCIFQFAAEINKFFNHSLNVQVIHQSNSEIKASKYKVIRKKIIESWGEESGPDIILLNYPILRIEKDLIQKALLSLKNKEIHSFLIFDESTAFKSLTTQVSKAVSYISACANKVLSLTATLCKGKLTEIYGMFKNVGISICPTKKDFEKHYCIIWQHPSIWYLKVVRGFKNVALFKEKIDPYCIILKKSDISASLPPFRIQKRFLEHSPEQLTLLKDIYSGVLALTPEGIDYQNIDNIESQKFLESLTEVGYVKRTLISPEIVAPERFTELSPKTEEILRMLEEEFVDEKVVIYTPSKKYLRLLMKTIKENKETPDFYKKPLEISGDIPADVRYQYVQDFSNTNIHNLLIIDDAGNSAINLQASSVLIITSLPDSWGNLIQLVGRLSRIGSAHKSLLLIFLLHEDSQDFDEYCILQRQGMLFQAIHGDVEKGLLDTSVLRGVEHEGISDEEFISQSVSHLLIGTRKRRAEKYGSF